MEFADNQIIERDGQSFQFHLVHGPCYGAGMDDQIIDSAMALSLHTDACRTRPLVGWVVMRDPPDLGSRSWRTRVESVGQISGL
jgi:hypothetical protein